MAAMAARFLSKKLSPLLPRKLCCFHKFLVYDAKRIRKDSGPYTLSEPLLREAPSQSLRPTHTHVPLEDPRELNTEKQAKGDICQSARSEIGAAANSLVKDDVILVIPIVASPAPNLDSRREKLQ